MKNNTQVIFNRSNSPELVKKRQELFLKQFVKHGTIVAACNALGFHRDTVAKWKSGNTYGFSEKFHQTEQDFREGLENIGIKSIMTVLEQKEVLDRTHSSLLMFFLKGFYPEKYKEQINISDDDAVENLKDLKAMYQEYKKQNFSEEGVIVEESTEDKVNQFLSDKKG